MTQVKYETKKNPYMTDFQRISRRQVELAIELRAYRNRHNISQVQLAHIATAYGKPYNVKFTNVDISAYERYIHVPSEVKMRALLNMLGLEIEELDI